MQTGTCDKLFTTYFYIEKKENVIFCTWLESNQEWNAQQDWSFWLFIEAFFDVMNKCKL